MVSPSIDLSELVKRAIKYLVEGLMVAIAAFAIPKRSLKYGRDCTYFSNCGGHIQYLRYICACNCSKRAFWCRFRNRC